MIAIYLAVFNLVLVLGLVVFRPMGETIIQNVMRRFENYVGVWFLLGLFEMVCAVCWFLWFVPRPGFTS